MTKRLNQILILTRLYKQQYSFNDEFYTPGGPIFLTVGGPFYMQYGHVIDIARDAGAFLVGFNFRFHGENRPTPDVSLESLRFLKTDQILADMVVLINHLKINELANAKVIVCGWDYYSNYAVWFAQKYPHFVNGVWASSAVLHKELGLTSKYRHKPS